MGRGSVITALPFIVATTQGAIVFTVYVPGVVKLPNEKAPPEADAV